MDYKPILKITYDVREINHRPHAIKKEQGLTRENILSVYHRIKMYIRVLYGKYKKIILKKRVK